MSEVSCPIFLGYAKLEDLVAEIKATRETTWPGNPEDVYCIRLIETESSTGLAMQRYMLSVMWSKAGIIHYWRACCGEVKTLVGCCSDEEHQRKVHKAAVSAFDATKKYLLSIRQEPMGDWAKRMMPPCFRVIEATVAYPRGFSLLSGTSDHIVYQAETETFELKEPSVEGINPLV